MDPLAIKFPAGSNRVVKISPECPDNDEHKIYPGAEKVSIPASSIMGA
jgi:hypothetical protein